jgi:hypothetical protein
MEATALEAPQPLALPEATPAAFADPIPPQDPKPQPIDRMEYMRERLKVLGAAYYRLETTDAASETFRFQCKMCSPANPNYVRYFEATASDPMRAVQHVLDQVEMWLNGREASPQ